MSNVKDTARYAGFWVRVVAFIIDLVIIGIILTPLLVWLSAGAPDRESGYYLVYTAIIGLPLCLLVTLAYYAGFWTWRGQTPGKMAMRVIIVRTNGEPLGLGRAALRYLGYFVQFSFIMSIGIRTSVYEEISLILVAVMVVLAVAVVAFHKQKRGLHDIIASTCVVVKAKSTQQRG